MIMGLLLSFSPFLAFLVGERHFGIVPALCAGASVAVALLVRERLRGARETRVLELGTAVLLGGLALCAATVGGIAWSVGLVRLVLDLGLMLLVLAGVAAGKPFTLSYARGKVTPERAATAGFLRINQAVSAAWAGAFGVLALADGVWMARPDWPLAVSLAIGVSGLLGALALTRWLPRRMLGRG